MRYRLGVVDVTFWCEPESERDRRAREMGFEHIDVLVDVDPASLVLPVGCPTSYPKPQPGWCATPAPRGGAEMWDAAVRWWRRSPGALLEPHKSGVVNSMESVREIQAAVPGLRLLVDTGHVADWGDDPLELLEHADHVQLRQGCPGSAQLHVDDPRVSSTSVQCWHDSTPSTIRAVCPSSTSTSPNTAGRSTTPSAGPTTSARTWPR